MVEEVRGEEKGHLDKINQRIGVMGGRAAGDSVRGGVVVKGVIE